MRSRALSAAAVCALALLAVVALVAWRGPEVAITWSSPLRVTAVVAVVALAGAVLAAAVVALGPRPPDRVRVAVPADGPPTTTVVAHPGPRRWLLAAVTVAVLGTVPVLLVLVLSATGGPAVAAPVPGAASPPGSASPSVPPATDPPGSPSISPPPTGAPPTSPPAADPSPTSPGTSAAAPVPSPSVPPSPPAAGAPPAPGPPASQGAPPPAPPSTPTPTPAPPPACTAVVARGDTLWDLVRDRLPPGARPDQLAAATRAAYAANAAVIGPDPGLIRPGQVLDACG